MIRNRKTILLVAAMMLLSVVAVPGAFAAVTVDTETTNTASESDWQDGTVVTDLDNSSKESTLEVSSDNATSGDDFDLYLTVNDSDSDQDGEQIYHSGAEWTATNSSQGHYELNVTHGDAFSSLERDANENVTVDVEVVVNEGNDTSEESVTFQITADNDAETAVAVVYPDDDGTETTETTAAFETLDTLNVFSDSDVGAVQTEEDVGVADNTSTVRIVSEDSNVTDPFDEAATDASDGDFLTTATMTLDDTRVPVFYQSADVEWLDTDSDTYATVSSDGSTLTVHNANETVDEGDVTVTATGNDAIGFFATRSMLADYDASFTERVSLASSAINLNGSPFEE